MKTRTSIITLLLFVISTTSIWAQSNFDANRMNRDIKILENVMQELFRVSHVSNSSGEYVILTDRLYGSQGIRGTYLPGYGVIFMVQRQNTGLYTVSTSTRRGDKSRLNEYSFVYGDDDKDREMNKESITNRIKGFLADYAPTIGQLKDNENIMVIYGTTRRGLWPEVYGYGDAVAIASGDSSDDKDDKEEIPIISVVTSKKDIDDLRSGKLSRSAFENKISVAETTPKDYLDLKVLGNIFNTALKEQGEKSFRLSGSVGHIYMENFGALFSFDVRFRNSGDRNLLFGQSVFSARRNVTRNGQVVVGSAVDIQDEDRKAREEEYIKNVADAHNKLVQNMKEYLVDYGRTLITVKNNQNVLVTINLNERVEGVPERIDFQIKKSTLDQLDRGNITRAAALGQITVTEY